MINPSHFSCAAAAWVAPANKLAASSALAGERIFAASIVAFLPSSKYFIGADEQPYFGALSGATTSVRL